MIQGSTPTHYFELPFDVSNIKTVHINYAQDKQIIVTKTERDCMFGGNVLEVTLTQEDTLALDHSKPVEIQIRVITFDGASLVSVISKVGIAECLETEVLV